MKSLPAGNYPSERDDSLPRHRGFATNLVPRSLRRMQPRAFLI